jgi:hypothetical protein
MSRMLALSNVPLVYVILGGQCPTKSTYDATEPWALPNPEEARKVRLALNFVCG